MTRLLEFFLVTLGLCAVLVTSCISCLHEVARIQQVQVNQSTPQKYFSSVALLQSQPGEDAYAPMSATAFAIDNTRLMTAGHFCNSIEGGFKDGIVSDKILVISADFNGILFPEGNATIKNFIFTGTLADDICIIEMDQSHTLVPVKFSNRVDIVEVEDPVTIVGAPHGFFPIRRDGYVWNVHDAYLSITAFLKPGSSGSPIMWNGEVIGMVVRGIDALDGAILAVRANDLVDFIQENKEN